MSLGTNITWQNQRSQVKTLFFKNYILVWIDISPSKKYTVFLTLSTEKSKQGWPSNDNIPNEYIVNLNTVSH